VSRTLFKEIILLGIIVLGSVLVAVGAAWFISGTSGGEQEQTERSALESVSITMENNLRDLIKTQLDAEEKYVTSPVVTGAVTRIKDRLLPLVKENPFKVEILVVDSPMVNAVTFPGGLMVVFSGLIKYTDSAEELASIIAHELGHVVHRDSMHLLVRNFTLSFLLNFLSGGRTPQLADEIIRNLLNSSYSREQEERADGFAFTLLTKAGINPLHMAHMFEKFEKMSGSQSGLLKYFNTHPPLDSRRKQALESAAEFAETNTEEKKFMIDWSKVKKALPSVMDE
jgi:predicted Zn-dependent protease